MVYDSLVPEGGNWNVYFTQKGIFLSASISVVDLANDNIGFRFGGVEDELLVPHGSNGVLKDSRLESSLLVRAHHLQNALLECNDDIGIYRVISLGGGFQVSGFQHSDNDGIGGESSMMRGGGGGSSGFHC